MIWPQRVAVLLGCLVSATTLPSFAQPQGAAAAPAPAEAPRAPAAPAAPVKPEQPAPPAPARGEATAEVVRPAPVASIPRPTTKERLDALHGQVAEWHRELRKSPTPSKTEQIVFTALNAIEDVQKELPKARGQRRRVPFKKLSNALKDLEAVAEARDEARTRLAARDAAPTVGPTTQAIQETKDAASDEAPLQPATAGRKITLEDGTDFNYGLTVSLFRLSVARLEDEPARRRNYSPKFEALPAEFGFQFTYRPPGTPWRLRTASKEGFQLMSVGGILLARVDNDDFRQGEVGIAASLQFLEDSVGLGLGFDLYRGVPVQGADGQRGEATAYTGLFSWALARDGEITPENVFVLLTVNIAGLAGKISDKGSDE